MAEPQKRWRGRNISEQGVELSGCGINQEKYRCGAVPLPFGQDRGARFRLNYCSRQKKEGSGDGKAVDIRKTGHGSCS